MTELCFLALVSGENMELCPFARAALLISSVPHPENVMAAAAGVQNMEDVLKWKENKLGEVYDGLWAEHPDGFYVNSI